MDRILIIRKVIDEILRESQEDYIYLREIIWLTLDKEEINDNNEVKFIAIKIVEIVLKKGWFQPGLFFKYEWEVWDFTLDEIISYLEQNWFKLHCKEDLCEVIWLEATEKGLEMLRDENYQAIIDGIEL